MNFKHFDPIAEDLIVVYVGLVMFICINSLLG
jgi:hypothetical protein